MLEISFWTSANVAELQRLREENYSAAQCARVLGITRNAVIGKINRLGLNKKSSDDDAMQRHKPSPPNKRFDAIEDFTIPVTQRCSLSQLTNWTCRWPIGDPKTPNFFYCGSTSADLINEHPYCTAHEARAAPRQQYWMVATTISSSAWPTGGQAQACSGKAQSPKT